MPSLMHPALPLVAFGAGAWLSSDPERPARVRAHMEAAVRAARLLGTCVVIAREYRAARAWTPDDEGEDVTPDPPAPAPAAAPPSMLTEQQKGAVREYLRNAMYDQFTQYLLEQYPGTAGEVEESKCYNRKLKEWESADSRRMAMYGNSDASTIDDRTADERVTKAVGIIAEQAREAVADWDVDMYAEMETTAVAAHLDRVAQDAVQQVEDYMRQDSHGFFDAEEGIGVDDLHEDSDSEGESYGTNGEA